MILVFYAITIAFLFGLPFVLARWANHHYHVSWKLFWVGMLTFLGSQVLHIPLVQSIGSQLYAQGVLVYAIVLGLLAGIFEETARLVGYRILKSRANSFGASIMLGIGHSGLESIGLVGITVLANLVVVLAVAANGPNVFGLPTQTGQAIQAQLPEFWSQPVYMPLISAYERITAIVLHITLSVMVWLSYNRRNLLWFGGAVLYHALVDAVAVYASIGLGWSNLALEGIMTLFTVINIGLLVYFSRMPARPSGNEPVDTAPTVDELLTTPAGDQPVTDA